MKKYLAILLTIAMAACTTEPGKDDGGGSTPDPEVGQFIQNARGVYTLGEEEIQLVDTTGNIVKTSDDTVVYEYKKEYNNTRALYINKASTKHNIVEYKDNILVFLGDFTTPKEGDTAQEDFVDNGTVINPSSDAPVVTPVAFELADGVYDLPNDRKVTVTQVDEKPSFSEVRDTVLYTHVKALTKNQGIFVNTAGRFVGIEKSDTDPATITLYAQDKNPRATWYIAEEVSFTEPHLYTINPDEPVLPENTPAFVTVAYTLSPITVGDKTYTMDKTGDLSVDGTPTYKFKTAPTLLHKLIIL